MSHNVKCIKCGKVFDRDKISYEEVAYQKYIHKECPIKPSAENLKKMKEIIDKDKFFQLVKEIYGKDYNYMMINKQAENYIQEYGYSWSGMRASLLWFYNVQEGSVEEGNGGIGIIPYVYDKAKEYYYNLYQTQEKNMKIELRQPVVQFQISSPQGIKRPPRLFDWEEEN